MTNTRHPMDFQRPAPELFPMPDLRKEKQRKAEGERRNPGQFAAYSAQQLQAAFEAGYAASKAQPVSDIGAAEDRFLADWYNVSDEEFIARCHAAPDMGGAMLVELGQFVAQSGSAQVLQDPALKASIEKDLGLYRKVMEGRKHPDDAAVDRFAAAMKEKLAKARAKGRGGWQQCPTADLSHMLREHVEKGDPTDVANFAMFLWNLGAGIHASQAHGKSEAVAYPSMPQGYHPSQFNSDEFVWDADDMRTFADAAVALHADLPTEVDALRFELIEVTEERDSLRAQVAAPAADAAVVAQVGWIIWWGVGDMQPSDFLYPTREAAEASASEMKTHTEVRPAFCAPSNPSQSTGDSVRVEGDAKDAARYRWLRDASTQSQQDGWLVRLPEQQDAYADAALAQQAAPAPDAVCTCPSGDGSLRWPCPAHPAAGDSSKPKWQKATVCTGAPTTPGAIQSGKVLMAPAGDRIKVKNERTGREYWIHWYNLV